MLLAQLHSWRPALRRKPAGASRVVPASSGGAAWLPSPPPAAPPASLLLLSLRWPRCELDASACVSSCTPEAKAGSDMACAAGHEGERVFGFGQGGLHTASGQRQ